MSELERRISSGRASVMGTPSHPVIGGTAIVFNERSQDLGGFVEVIKPEAIKRTLDEQIDLRAFFDHDPSKVLGRQSAGTLKVTRTSQGLNVEIDPPQKSQLTKDLLESIERRDITGMSFAFRTMEGGDDWQREGGMIVRYVTDMRVYEVSVVSMPAYSQTDVQVAQRALMAFQQRSPWSIAQLRERALARAAAWR